MKKILFLGLFIVTGLLSGCATLAPGSQIAHNAPKTLSYATQHAQWSHLYGGKTGKKLTDLEWLTLADTTGSAGLSLIHEPTPKHIPGQSGSAPFSTESLLLENSHPDASLALMGLGILLGQPPDHWKVVQKRLDKATHNGVFVQLLRIVPRPTTKAGLESLAVQTIKAGLSSIANQPLPDGAPPIRVQGDGYTTTLMTVSSSQKPDQKYLGTFRLSPRLHGFTAGWWGINPYLTAMGKLVMGESVQYYPPYLPDSRLDTKQSVGSNAGYLTLQFARAESIPGHQHHLLVALQYQITNPNFQTASWIAKVRKDPLFSGNWYISDATGLHPLHSVRQ